VDPRLIISYSTEPWAQVASNIYIGGTYKLVRLASGETDVVYNEPAGFPVVVSMAKCGAERWIKGVQHLGYAIADGPIEEKDTQPLLDIAAYVTMMAVSRGTKVLIRCRAGCNRSALVAALAMICAGGKRETVIEQIRSVRACALSNEYYVRYIENGEL